MPSSFRIPSYLHRIPPPAHLLPESSKCQTISRPVPVPRGPRYETNVGPASAGCQAMSELAGEQGRAHPCSRGESGCGGFPTSHYHPPALVRVRSVLQHRRKRPKNIGNTTEPTRPCWISPDAHREMAHAAGRPAAPSDSYTHHRAHEPRHELVC